MKKNQNVLEKLDLLRSQLTVRKTTTGFAKFPMSVDDAILCIEAALQVEVEKRGNRFCNSDKLQSNIAQIARFFTEPTAKFGILLCGGVGNGKSSMMYALQNLIWRLNIPLVGNTSFGVWGMRIETAKFIYNQVKVDFQQYRHIQNVNMLGIDDLGVEESTLMDYGNRVTPVIDLISHRYDRMLFTMVTTNLTPKKIRSTYGDRVADRINEMMLILPYKNPSFRTPEKTREETMEV